MSILKIASAKTERTWNSSVIISILALLFSFGTTGVSYLRTRQQDIHDARSELRSLVERLNRLPVENIENYKKYADDPETAGNLSGLLNGENGLIAKQAYDLINRIPDSVGAAEYLNVANALNQSALVDKSAKLFEGGLKNSADANDEVGLLRSYGATLFSVGDAENGRAQYRKALSIFQKFPTTNNDYIESTHFLTEKFWSTAEYSLHQCGYAKTHLQQAEIRLSAMTAGPYTEQLRAQFNKLQPQIIACAP